MRVVVRKSLRKSDFDYIDLPETQQEPVQKRAKKPARQLKQADRTTDATISSSSPESSTKKNEYVLDEDSAQSSNASIAEPEGDQSSSPVIIRKPHVAKAPMVVPSSPEQGQTQESLPAHALSPSPQELPYIHSEEEALDAELHSSEEEDEDYSPPVACGEQLLWIMEHAARSKMNLPDDAFNDLVSLVCDDELQPKQVPTYLLAKALTHVFRNEIRLCDWSATSTAFQQFDEIEKRLQVHLTALEGHTMQKYLVKERDILANMFRYLYIGLRRWAVVQEAMKRKTTNGRLLALINVLFPSQLPAHTMAAERGMTEQMGNHRGALLQFASGLQQYRDSGPARNSTEYPGYGRFATQMSWTSVHTVLSKYLVLVQQAIAKVEHFLEPIPEPLQAMGIKRNDTVMNRIARHLIGTCKYGYDPRWREEEAAEALRERKREERRLNKMRQREADMSYVSSGRAGASPEL